MIRMAVVTVALVSALAFAAVVSIVVINANDTRSKEANRLATRVNRESGIRERQFCQLLNTAQDELAQQLAATRRYLRSPAGRKTDGNAGMLNEYIRRVSLPQLRQRVIAGAGALPAVCHKYRYQPGTPHDD